MSDSEVFDYRFMFYVDVLNSGFVLFDHHLNVKLQLLDFMSAVIYIDNLLLAFNDLVLIDDVGFRYDSFCLFLMVDGDVVDCGFVFDVDILDRLSVFFDQHFNLTFKLFNFMSIIYNSIFVDNPF